MARSKSPYGPFEKDPTNPILTSSPNNSDERADWDHRTRLHEDLVSRRAALVAVANVGRDHSWTGNTFSQANLYGYGRLTWDIAATSEDIAHEWAAASFAGDDVLHSTLADILLAS